METPRPLNRHPAAWHSKAFYPFWVRENVRFADLDPLGHVNNNTYGTYFEIGRIAMWQDLFKGNFWDAEYYSLMRAAHIEYNLEVKYPNTLDIGVRILKLGTSSSEAAVGIFIGDTCHATSHTVGVRVNAKTHEVTPLPPEFRNACKKYM